MQHFEEACLQGVEFFRPHTPDLRIEAVRVEAIIEILGREEDGRQDQPVYVGFVHREALVQLHEPIHVDQPERYLLRRLTPEGRVGIPTTDTKNSNFVNNSKDLAKSEMFRGIPENFH